MLKNKEKYEAPVLEIMNFTVRDILTISPDPDPNANNDVNLPIYFFD